MANELIDKTSIESVELTKLLVETTHIIDEYAVLKSGLKLQAYMEPMLRAMVYKLKSYVLAEEIDNRSKIVYVNTTHPVYCNWWQHFKGEVFPDWLKKKFPPRYNYVTKTGKKLVTFRRHATYPKANILFPDQVGTLIKYNSQ